MSLTPEETKARITNRNIDSYELEAKAYRHITPINHYPDSSTNETITISAGTGSTTITDIKVFWVHFIYINPTTSTTTYKWRLVDNTTSNVLDETSTAQTGRYTSTKERAISNEVKLEIFDASVDEDFKVHILYS